MNRKGSLAWIALAILIGIGAWILFRPASSGSLQPGHDGAPPAQPQGVTQAPPRERPAPTETSRPVTLQRSHEPALGAATPTSATLHVRVIWALNKNPVSGAEAVLTGAEADAPSSPSLAQGRSDTQGEVVLHHPTPLGQARLTVRHPSAAPAERQLILPWQGTLVVELLDQGIIHGRVIRAQDHAPVAGASVCLLNGPPRPPRTGARDQPPPPFMSATTGADGTFRFQNLGAATYRMTAAKDRERSYLCEADVPVIQLQTGEASGPHDLALKAGAVLKGIVTDKSSGKPVAGAQIEKLAAPSVNRPMLMTERAQTATDGSGAYRLEGLPFETVKVRASADGYASQWTWAALREPETECNIALEPGGTVEVMVIDERKAPLPGASVTLQHAGVSATLESPTDTRGLAIFKDVSRTAPPLVTAFKSGYRKPVMLSPDEKFRGYSDTLATPVRFKPGESLVRVVVALHRLNPGLFCGRVVDGRGVPLVMAHVRARLTGYEAFGGSLHETLTGQNGQYRLAVESAGDRYLIWAAAEGRGLAPDVKREFESGTPDRPAAADFTLLAGHWLKGVAIDLHKNPLAGVSVRALTLSQAAGYDSLAEVASERAVTDAAGSFEFKELAGEDLRLLAQKDGYKNVMRSPCEIDQEIRLVMEKESVMRGRVVDGRTGAPVPAFTVLTSLLGNERRQQRYAPDGTFDLADTNPNLLRSDVVIRAEGYAPTLRRDLTPRDLTPESEILFAMLPGAPLSGRLIDAATGQPVNGAAVLFGFYDGRRPLNINHVFGNNIQNVESTLTGADGGFRFLEGAESGSLIIMAGGYEPRVVLPRERAGLAQGGMLSVPLKAGGDPPQGRYWPPDLINGLKNMARQKKGGTMGGAEQ